MSKSTDQWRQLYEDTFYSRQALCKQYTEEIKQLTAQLTTANEENKRLREEIQARRQWQKCPQCKKTFATDS